MCWRTALQSDTHAVPERRKVIKGRQYTRAWYENSTISAHKTRDTSSKKEGKRLILPITTLSTHQGPRTPPKNPSTPSANMAEHKNSHKGGRAGSRIGSDPEEGPIDKNKTRLKYRNSVPLQEHQSLARSKNLETHKRGNGNSLRPGSRARSEASDITNENDVSPTRTRMQPGGEYSLGENMNSLNP